jgi:hypothetical protein
VNNKQLPDESTYFQVDDKIFFHLLDINNSKQLDFDPYMWGLTLLPRFKTSLGEKFDLRGKKDAQMALEITITPAL